MHGDDTPPMQYTQFTTHTPPDITSNTRIVAVCGTFQKKAMPKVDGWFLSDFFAFYTIFRGMTQHQTWMHCLDIEDLLKVHGPYLHGSPFKTRKVVLDTEIVKKAKAPGGSLHYLQHGALKLAFQKKLVSECQAAANMEQ